MAIYILANFYTLLWISIRPIRKLGRFIKGYRNGVNQFYHGKQIPENFNAILDIHGGMKSLDFEILLDLLAEKMGLEIALRIVAIVDAEFGRDWTAIPRDHVSEFFWLKETIRFAKQISN